MNQSITNISVDVLKIHPRNTEFFDDISGEEYERFKKSIQEDGLLSPLIVSPDMTIISGHQRLKACKELDYKTVPVIINDDLDNEDEKLRKLIAANFGRAKNDPIKQAKLLKEYEKLSGVQHGGNRKSSGNNSRLINQESIAKELGVDVTTIRNIKRLTTLLPDLQDIISEGRITPTTGYKVIAKLSDEEQRKLFEQLPSAQKFTQRQVEDYVSQIQAKDNIIAGYEMKLKSKQDSSPDIEQLLDEKEKLEVEKRQWYEKAQSFKKEASESKKRLEQAQSVQPKERIVEVEKIPADYEKIKRELAEANREIEKSRIIIKNIPANPNIATSFGTKDLIKILEHFSNSISSFQFADDALAKCSTQESQTIQEFVAVTKREFDVILSKLKGRVA